MTFENVSSRHPAWWYLGGCAALFLITGCGGGGGGSSGGSTSVPIAEAQHCAAPRPLGALDPDGRPYGDVQGTLADEKAWVRAYID